MSYKVSYDNTCALQLSKVKKFYTYEEFRKMFAWNSDHTVITFNPDGLGIEVGNTPTFDKNNPTEEDARSHGLILVDEEKKKNKLKPYIIYKIKFNGKVVFPENSACIFCNYNNVTGLSNYYQYAEEIDLRNVDLNKITNASHLFSSLSQDGQKIIFPENFTGDNIVNAYEMFSNTRLENNVFCLPKFTGKNIVNAGFMFSNFGKQNTTEELNLPEFTGEKIENAQNIFVRMETKRLILPKFTGKNIKYCSYFTYNSSSLEYVFIPKFNPDKYDSFTLFQEDRNIKTIVCCGALIKKFANKSYSSFHYAVDILSKDELDDNTVYTCDCEYKNKDVSAGINYDGVYITSIQVYTE